MADGGRQTSGRFSAFISYSSEDVAFTRRLHKRLETYRLPRHLRSLTPGAPPPDRLKPLFRDVDELIAAYDLSTAVQDALAQSDYLIVVCSPNAVESEWVGREIDYFRSLHGDSHILAVLIDGTPATAFHPALRGAAGGPSLEPLAADFRPESPSRRLAMLKLVAALAGVELDDLIHRDAQRQMRRTVAVAASAMAAVLVVGVLATLTLTARAETERKRQQATGMVDHMLTDVRKNLQRSGRLDQLAAVNESAMAYYRGQDLAKLTDDELRQRAKLLQAMGEDDEKRGDLAKAREEFVEAHRTTAKLLAARPNDTARIFAHAQSEYWVGFAAWRAGDGAEAKRRFEAYAHQAERLTATEPLKSEWICERGYAESNLGLLAMRQAGDLASAESRFSTAIKSFQQARQTATDPRPVSASLAEALAWRAEARRLGHRYPEATQDRLRQRDLLTEIAHADPSDNSAKDDLAVNEFALGRLEAEAGHLTLGAAQMAASERKLRDRLRSDPEDRRLAERALAVALVREIAMAGVASAPSSAHDRKKTMAECAQTSREVTDGELLALCLIADANAALGAGQPSAAAVITGKLRQLRRTDIYTSRWGINIADQVHHLESKIRSS